MELNLAEKLSIVKMIYAMVKADSVVHPLEIGAVCRLIHILDFDSNHIQVAQNLELDQAIAIVGKMTETKKDRLEQILKDLAQCDGFSHLKETDVLEGIFSVVTSD